MKVVYAFERLELVVGGRTVNLLPTGAARRLFGYIVPVVRPWPFRIRWTGILMTLDLLVHASVHASVTMEGSGRASEEEAQVREQRWRLRAEQAVLADADRER